MPYIDSAIDYLNRTMAVGVYALEHGDYKKAVSYQEQAKALYDLIVNEWGISLKQVDIGCEIKGYQFTFIGFVKAAR